MATKNSDKVSIDIGMVYSYLERVLFLLFCVLGIYW